MKLNTNPNSRAALQVRIALHYKELPYQEETPPRSAATAKGFEQGVAALNPERLVPVLTEAALSVSPLFNISHQLPELQIPTRLIHGRGDRLIPFTESLRLAELMDSRSETRLFLTGLFSHSQRDAKRSRVAEWLEQLRFLRLMSVVLGSL